MLSKYNVELIGANIEAIKRGEDREAFKGVVERAGGEVCTLGDCSLHAGGAGSR